MYQYYILRRNFRDYKNNAENKGISLAVTENSYKYSLVESDAEPERFLGEVIGADSKNIFYSKETDSYDIIKNIMNLRNVNCLVVTEDEQKLEDYYRYENIAKMNEEIQSLKEQLNEKEAELSDYEDSYPEYKEAPKAVIENQVERFIKEWDYNRFEERISQIVVGQESIGEMAFNVYTYLESITKGNIIKNNFIIAGPSGSGKTHFYNTLKKIIQEEGLVNKLPILQIDISMITQEGFKGKNVSAIYDMIEKACGNNGKYAIIFLDEFDKKILPSYDGTGTNINTAIQGEFLTLVEGAVRGSCDTRKCLFIAAGAFQKIRDDKKNKPNGIGFEIEEEKADDFVEIDYDDILESGGACELIGRFTGGIYNFKPMEERAIKKLILSMTEEIVANEEVSVKITPKAMKAFVEFANSKFGCRMLKRELVRTINPVLRQMKMSGEPQDDIKLIEVTGVGKARLKAAKPVKAEPDYKASENVAG